VSADRGIVEYAIDHTTTYEYVYPVPVSHHVARLTPRSLPGQQVCHAHTLEIEPPAAVVRTHIDYYGNTLTFFATQSAHTRLTVRARSRVSLQQQPAGFDDTPPWEVATDRTRMPIDALDCVLDPGAGRVAADVAAYARESFPPGRDLVEAVADLTARVHRDFIYDAGATTVTTTLAEVFQTRRGVCQDFARFQIACLRSVGIPARYVSGYLETLPPPGKPRLVGADASHAWVSFHCPVIGWIDTDPTNNLLPTRTHVTLAWGRDFPDVSPIRGVILGGGEHVLRVSVDVARV
jgi:transglutaminase-like putative cysteine protease